MFANNPFLSSLNRISKYLVMAFLLMLVAMMKSSFSVAGSLTDYAENKIYDATLRGEPLNAPTTFYVALYTSTPTDTGIGVEVSGGGYARVPVLSSLSNWSGTQALGSTVISNGTDGKGENNIVLTFPQPVSPWGVVTGICLVDAPIGGNAWICSDLTVNKTINGGDAAPSLGVGAWTFTIDSNN